MGFGRCCAVVCVLLVLAACTAPGKPYSYLDLKFLGGVGATPALPAVNQDFVVNFTIFNTDSKPLAGVTWRAYETVLPTLPPLVPPATPAVGSGGPSTLGAYAQPAMTLTIAGGRPAGTYTYTIFLDPDAAISEREEGNNRFSINVIVADLNVAFDSSVPPSVDTIPAVGDLTLRFAIFNQNNAGVLAPVSTSVGYQIFLDDGAIPPITAAVVPTSASQASPVLVAANSSSGPIVVTVPRPAAGTHTYTLVLTSSVAESTTTDNATMVITPTVD